MIIKTPKNLSKISELNNFAKLSIDGTFNIIESNLSYTHNFSHGFLLFFHLPIRSLHIKNTSFLDLAPNNTSPEWQTLLHSFEPIMNYYDIDISSTKQAGMGDFTTLIGWTHNYQDTKVLDFIDGTFTLGVLTPTGKKKNENKLFSLPLGYNGHWGFPVNGELSLGMYEWITLGAYVHGLFFLNNKQCTRLKTSPQQSGIIKLATGTVDAKKGATWNTGLFFKADHFIYGLSFITAYSYSGEQNSILTPCNSPLLNYATINSDRSLKGWSMHTFHFAAEYDFAQQNTKTAPRMGVFYNYQITGKQIFQTNCGGGSFGLDIAWRF